MEPDYDRAIAEAARAYVSTRRDHRMLRTEETGRAESAAYEKLAWMVDARRQGWDPATYVPEW